MVRLKKILSIILEALALIGLIAGLVFTFQYAKLKLMPSDGNNGKSLAAYPPPSTEQPPAITQQPPAPTGMPVPTLTPFPPVNWGSAPACENQPINTRSVCARIAFLYGGNNLLEARWGDSGIETIALLPQEFARSIETNLDYFVASPDGSRIALASNAHEAGGVLFLLDLGAQEGSGFFRQITPTLSGKNTGLPDNMSVSIIGWHPNNQHLLVGPGDAGSVYWIDLASNTADVIALDTGGNGGSVFVDLSPGGDRFVYIGADYSKNIQRLNLYDLKSGRINTLLEQSFSDGVLSYPRFSPDGDRVAYMVQVGHPTTDITSAIHIIDIVSKETSILVKASLVTAEPAWSPDGNWIAFTKNEPDEPIAITSNDAPKPRQGNIWIVSVDGKDVQQITFVVGRADQPSWSSDSQTLSFISHDRQIGMVNINRPGKIWRIAGPIQSWTNSISTSFMP